MKDYTPETGEEADKILELARERRKQCLDSESTTRDEGLDDLRFARGDQWPTDVRNFREQDPSGARPCLTINKTGKFTRQVVNDSRQNSPAIHVFPVGGGSDKDVAKVLNGLIRDVEQRTDADTCYDTAIESTARVGEGYWRLISRYIEDQPSKDSKNAFDQEVAFQRIRNPFSVHVDPSAIDPAASDQQYNFVDEWWPTKLFKDKYGDNGMVGLDSNLGEYEPHWIGSGGVLIADYYSIEKDQKRTLCLLKTGAQVILEEQEVSREDIVAMREIELTRCVVRKITGSTILEKTIWPCRYIPVFRVIGEEFEIEGEVIYQGLIRPQKDSQRMYNYWVSAATEKGALETKAPYIGAEGQFEGHEHQWQNANRVPYAYLEYKQVELEGHLAPPPQRNTASFAGAADIQMAQIASEDMKDTAGIFDAGLGQQGNEKSGRAILARQREGDISTFHYVDNLGKAIRHCGRVLVEILPKYLTGARIVRIVGEDDDDEMVPINTINKKADDKGNEIIERINDITIGRYDVRVSIGPSYTTRRVEAADSMIQFVQAVPQAGQAVMDLLAKAMDWPGAEMIAERLKKMLPPELTEDDEQDEITPEKVQAMIQQVQQEMAEQFQSSLEERDAKVNEFEAQIKQFEAMTERMQKVGGSEEALREQVAGIIAEYLQGVAQEQ